MIKRLLNYMVWLLTGLLYAPVFFQLYKGRWESIDYTHAYYILPISLWLVWRDRDNLKQLAVEGSRTTLITGLSSLIFGCLMFIVGWRQDYLFISTLSLIPAAYGLIITLNGFKTAARLSFPILYLLLLVPPPLGLLDSVTLPMRYWVSSATHYILKLCHYPITQSGLMLSIGGHEIYMGAPCSGFRSLITMISIGLVYTYVIKGNILKKSILVGSIIPLALLGNLIRIVSMCLVTFYFGETIGHKYHDISGFVIFFVLVMGLIGLDSLLTKIIKK